MIEIACGCGDDSCDKKVFCYKVEAERAALPDHYVVSGGCRFFRDRGDRAVVRRFAFTIFRVKN